MPDSVLYHNPRCSKSREALALLQAHGIEPVVVPYLDQPPTVGQLRDLLVRLKLPVRALLRTGEAEFESLGLDDPVLTDEAVLAAMAAHPRLIERPIFVHDGRAVIGRPPSRVLELLR